MKNQLLKLIALVVCVVGTMSLATAQPDVTCPPTAPAEASALLAAAEACLESRGILHERDAAQALVYARAAAALESVSAIDLARAYELQAQAHFWLGERGQAIARQTQALSLLPTADRFLLRAFYMSVVDDYAGAITDAEEAIALAPRQLSTYLWLARYALDNADYALALDVLERAAGFAPDAAEVALLQGDVQYARADYAAAQAVYERYLALTDDVSPLVVARLSVIERRLGN